MQKRLLFIAVLLSAICNKIAAADNISIDGFSLTVGGAKNVEVLMTNADSYVGVQFDLYLPDGIAISADPAGSNRLPAGTAPQMAQQADGSYRFVIASLNRNPISGSEGAIVTLPLQASASVAAGHYSGYLRNVKLSKADGTGPTIAEQLVAITVNGAAATPVFTHEDNRVFISSDTEGALIHYIIGTGTPDSTSTVYSDGITVDRNCTVRAIALHPDFLPSEVATFVVDWFKVADVEFEPNGNQVTLSTTTADAVIHYTLSGLGSSETVGSTGTTEVTAPSPVTLTMEGDTHIEAYATRDGYTNSDVTSFDFHADGVTVSNPVFTHSGNTITITTQTEGATIHYTLDGSEPTAENTIYTGPFEVSSNVTIRAIALRDTYYPSQVTTFTVDWFKAEAPTFAFEGDNLVITTATEGAEIHYYNTAEVVYYETGDSVPERIYTAPFELMQNAAVIAWAEKQGMAASDTVLLDYNYDAWLALLKTAAGGQDVVERATGSSKVDPQLLDELGQKIASASNLYDERATYKTEDAEQLTAEIRELSDRVVSQLNAEGDPEPYVVIADNEVTFYYDGYKENRGGVEINNTETRTPLYASATTAVFDASFAGYRPTSTAYWFQECRNLTSISGISNLHTDNVTDMNRMFYGCSSLTSLDVSSFNTVNVTNMSFMFFACSGLTSLDLSSFNTVNVTDMTYMFYGCSSLTSLDVSSFNTANVTNMRSMFESCSSLTSLEVNGFNTANVNYMGGMFLDCSSLTSLDLSGFNTANVTEMNSMVYNCSSLTTIYVSDGWSTESVTDGLNMFGRCTSLVGGKGTVYTTEPVQDAGGSGFKQPTTADYARIDYRETPGYLTPINGYAADPTYTLGRNVLTINVPQEEGAQVYYFVNNLYDGIDFEHGDSVRTPNTLYTQPIVMDISSRVRFMTVQEGKAHSEIVVVKYIAQPALDFAYDATTGVLTVMGETTLDEAVSEVGGREQVAQTVTAIVWDKTTPLTADMLQGITNPNLLVYVNSAELAPQGAQNVVVRTHMVDGLGQPLYDNQGNPLWGWTANKIVLTDVESGNNDFYCPLPFTAEEISYTRTFTQQTQVNVSRGWETISLPFTVQTVRHEKNGLLTPFGDTSEGTRHYWLRQLTMSGLTSALRIEANTPYLISMPNNDKVYSAEFNQGGQVTFAATNVTVPPTVTESQQLANGSITLVPTMQRVARGDSIYALNVGTPRGTYLEGSVFESGLREVRPFEAYTLHADGPNGAPRFLSLAKIQSEAGVTGIEQVVDNGNEPAEVYDLQGRKVAIERMANGRLPKGVYIINGRKTVVR